MQYLRSNVILNFLIVSQRCTTIKSVEAGSDNKKRIRAIAVEIDHLSNELQRRLGVEESEESSESNTREETPPTQHVDQGKALPKRTSKREIVSGDRVKVTNTYGGYKNRIGQVLSTTSTQAEVLLEPLDTEESSAQGTIIRKWKTNLKRVRHHGANQ